MGQRHQLYFKVNESEDKTKIIAFHHQWLYGTLPLKRLKWVLQYESKANQYSSLKNTDSDSYGTNKLTLLTHLITTNAQEGLHSHVINVTEELTETKGKHEGCICPERGDNNDGITVVDLTQKKTKYAFIHFNKDYAPALKPLTAEEYVLSYYKEDDEKWKNWKIHNLCKFINRHTELLTIEELNKMFPTLYKDMWKERRKIDKSDPKDLPFLITGKFDYELNRIYAESLLAA